jgi:hypothetical protein
VILVSTQRAFFVAESRELPRQKSSLINFGGSRACERAATRERPPSTQIWRSNRGQILARGPATFIHLPPVVG